MTGRTTPSSITELSMCEVFVFGSNPEGEHYRGTARVAYERFGAKWGVCAGPTGQCYAIPAMHCGLEEIKPYVDDFVDYVRDHPNNRFLLTRVGCGTGSFTDKEMAPLFKQLKDAPNVCLPPEWLILLDEDELLDVYCTGVIPQKPKIEIPDVITEDDLIRLCREFKYIIGARIISAPKPEIRIRYVLNNDRFGYADFGNFILCESGELYVWSRNKEFADKHNQAVVEAYFEDECKGRGYCHRVIFAGVRTNYRDSNGDYIYTGDVLDLDREYMSVPLALATIGENSEGRDAIYAFVLDNHFIAINDCKSLTRVGTVFYQLDRDGEPHTISYYCYRFQPCFPDGTNENDRIEMAKYTPQFRPRNWEISCK